MFTSQLRSTNHGWDNVMTPKKRSDTNELGQLTLSKKMTKKISEVQESFDER